MEGPYDKLVPYGFESKQINVSTRLSPVAPNSACHCGRGRRAPCHMGRATRYPKMARLKRRTRYIHPCAPTALSVKNRYPYPLMLNHGKKRAMNNTKVAPPTTMSPGPQRLASKLGVMLVSIFPPLPLIVSFITFVLGRYRVKSVS